MDATRRDGALGDASPDATRGDAAAVDAAAVDAAAVDAAIARRAPVCGLMTREAGAAPALPIIEDTVIRVAWADLQPDPPPAPFAGTGWATIDGVLDRPGVRAVRLRIMAGRDAPAWVKALGGLRDAASCPAGGVHVFQGDGDEGCVPAFWETASLDAYDALMGEVARRYEGDLPATDVRSKVREIVDSACMTIYAEPFYRAHRVGPANQNLLAAGLTVAADDACHARAIEIHAARFPTIRTSLAINNWDRVTPDDPPDYVNVEWAPVRTLLDGVAIPTLGAGLVLQNNGLGEAEGCAARCDATRDCYWCRIADWAGAHGFQTETFEKLGGGPASDFAAREAGLHAAIDSAIEMRSNFVELPSVGPAGFGALDTAWLADRDAMLEAACAGR